MLTIQQIRTIAEKGKTLSGTNFTHLEKLDDNWLYKQRMMEAEVYRMEHFTKKQINSQPY